MDSSIFNWIGNVNNQLGQSFSNRQHKTITESEQRLYCKSGESRKKYELMELFQVLNHTS